MLHQSSHAPISLEIAVHLTTRLGNSTEFRVDHNTRTPRYQLPFLPSPFFHFSASSLLTMSDPPPHPSSPSPSFGLSPHRQNIRLAHKLVPPYIHRTSLLIWPNRTHSVSIIHHPDGRQFKNQSILQMRERPENRHLQSHRRVSCRLFA